jgi:NAD(P)-dependent dehydrogenase (short-subunit alcohol dehydrogenase family)
MLTNKSIVIVGGAGRLGNAFVKACKKRKNTVFVLDICNEKEWLELEIYCDLFIQTDINNPESLADAINQINSGCGKIDGVVNTAYPKNKDYGKAIFDTTLHDFNDNINLHLGGYFHVMQKFTQFFIKQGFGNIINIASIQGISAPQFEHYLGTNMVSPIEYSATKSAIIAISQYMAKYLKGKNIRVNCISPGGILENQPKFFLERYKSSCLNKGMLDTDDLVGTLLFLLSNQSKYINGQNIIVDDGWSL